MSLLFQMLSIFILAVLRKTLDANFLTGTVCGLEDAFVIS